MDSPVSVISGIEAENRRTIARELGVGWFDVSHSLQVICKRIKAFRQVDGLWTATHLDGRIVASPCLADCAKLAAEWSRLPR